MCHQNFYQPSEKIISLNVGNAGDIYLVSQLRCFDKFSCHKMHKLILMNVGGGKYLLKQPEYLMLQSRVSEGLFKLNL